MENKVGEAASLNVIAENLNNPRGITFDPNGDLYVTEAGIGGSGPIVPAPELDSIQSFGTTGAVTRVRNGVQKRVISDLPSLSLFPENSTPPQTKGSVLPATGAHDIEFQGKNAYVLLGYATTTDQQDVLDSAGGSELGGIVSFSTNSDGTFEKGDFFADLVAFEELDNPDDGAFLNNPFDLEVKGDTFYVADPGGNNFYSTDLQENVELETVFPTKTVDGVTFESVPTSVTIGPDGAFYVGELTGNFAPEGSASVYRLTPGNEPEVFADGFTQIMGLDFDDQGNLYVLEFSVNSGPPIPTEESDTTFTGALSQISPAGVRTTIVGPGEGLVGPTSLTVGPDNEIYVSNFGTTIGTGQVVRVDRQASVPEPNSLPSLLGVFTFGSWCSLRKRKLSGKIPQN